jgi:large subunit ribosomal protein L30
MDSEEGEAGKAKKPKSGLVAAVLVRGMIGASSEVKDTLAMLNLQFKNSCVVVEGTPVNKGMLKRCKDYLTYGEITPETFAELKKAREKKGKKHYALHPPRGGFERKGTKKSYAEKGSLGYRGEKINDLIRKML